MSREDKKLVSLRKKYYVWDKVLDQELKREQVSLLLGFFGEGEEDIFRIFGFGEETFPGVL